MILDGFKADVTVDASGHLCPVPIVMTEEKMKELLAGQVLRVLFTDPGAKLDLEAWCKASGNVFLHFQNDKPRYSATLRKGRMSFSRG